MIRKSRDQGLMIIIVVAAVTTVAVMKGFVAFDGSAGGGGVAHLWMKKEGK